MKNKKISLVLSVGVLIFAFAFFASQVFGQSWTPPTQQFPQGNTSAPLDVSTEPQTKSANLGANSVISNVTGVAPAFVMPQGSFIGSELGGGGSNKIFLTAGNNMIFTAAGGFLVNAPGGPASFAYSKGLTLPNYSTAVLGTGVQEGTLTYNNGKLYIFVPGGGQGQQQETRNNLLNNANAQTFNGRWAEVGGGTVINNYGTSSAPSVWLSGRGGVYTTTTVVSIGANNGTNLNMEVSGNAINFRVITAGGGGQSKNGVVNKAEAQTNTSAFSIIPGTGAVSFPAPLTAQNSLSVQGASGISINPAGAQVYSVRNNAGTVEFRNGGNATHLTLGQDGVLGVRGKIAYEGNTAQIVAQSGSESALQVGGVYGSTFRPGVLRLTSQNGQDGISLKQGSGKTLTIGASGTNDNVRINLDSLFTNGQSNCTNSGIKFLRIDADGDLVCDVLPASSGVEYVEMPGNRSDPAGFYGNRNGLNGTCGQASCEGTYDVSSLSEYDACFQTGWISRGANTSACFIFKDNGAGKWKVRIFEWWDGAAFCKISCIK